MHSRRTVLAMGAASAASACATGQGLGSRVRTRLPPVLVAEERIIRIDVGLRPYRPSGFRVAREEFGDKVLVHNYGHGGGRHHAVLGHSQARRRSGL